MKKTIMLALSILLLLTLSAPVPAGSRYTKAYKSKKRYIVTCNHHYDNKYNTLSKHDTVKAAIARIKKVRRSYRGQWYVWDSKSKKIVWPDLSTDKKKVKKAVAWATAVGNDPRHGYDTDGERTAHGCNLKYKRWGKCGDYGCSPLVETAYELFDFCNLRKISWDHKLTYYTSDGYGPLRGFNANNIVAAIRKSKKFKNVSADYARKGNAMLRPGDIVVNSNQKHTAIIVTKRRIVEGNNNENGVEFQRSQPGDQRFNQELNVSNYMNGYHFYAGIAYVFRPKT